MGLFRREIHQFGEEADDSGKCRTFRAREHSELANRQESASVRVFAPARTFCRESLAPAPGFGSARARKSAITEAPQAMRKAIRMPPSL